MIATETAANSTPPRARSNSLIAFLFLLAWQLAGAPASAADCKHLTGAIGGSTSDASDPVQEALHRKKSELFESIQKYSEALGPFQSPFRGFHRYESFAFIFDQLSTRKLDGKPSSLGAIRQKLSMPQEKDETVDEKLLARVLQEADQLLKISDVPVSDMQAQLLALRLTNEYLDRFRTPMEETDRDGEKIEKESEKKAEKEPTKKKEEKEKAPPPPWRDQAENYDPHTKDLNNSGDPQETRVMASANFPVGWWVQGYTTGIQRNASPKLRNLDLPDPLRSPAKDFGSSEFVTYENDELSSFKAYVPEGKELLQPADSRIQVTRMQNGGYLITSPFPKTVIPVRDETIENLTPPNLERLSASVGVPEHHWPKDLQKLFKELKPLAKSDPIGLAKKLQDHIRSHPRLYAIDHSPETDPVEAYNSGKFQCDHAFFIWASIMREVFHLPVRGPKGIRSKSRIEPGDNDSYLVIPQENHIWGQLYFQGRWHSFDPTPTTLEKKKPESSSDEKYIDSPLPRDERAQDKAEGDEGKDGKPTGDGAPVESETLLQKITKRTKDLFDAHKKTKGEQKKVEEKAKAPSFKMTEEELLKHLVAGSLNRDEKVKSNPLLDRIFRLLSRWALNPSLGSKLNEERLQQIKASPLNGMHKAETRAFFQGVLDVYRSIDQRAVNDALREMTLEPEKADLERMFTGLLQVRDRLEAYEATLDEGPIFNETRSLRISIREILNLFNSINHENVESISIAKQFFDGMPALVGSQIQNQFGLTQISTNPATQKLVKAIKAGDLNDMLRIRYLSPFVNFILNSQPRPEYSQIKLWELDTRRHRGGDLYETENPLDLPHSFLGQLDKDLVENFVEGTAYSFQHRRRVLIPEGWGQEEAFRKTVVKYDTSGSMSGEPGEFQADILATFAGVALSDLSPSGKQRHTCSVGAFDDKVYSPVEISTQEQAWDLIRHYRASLANTNGGTDIQKAILAAMAEIAEEQKIKGTLAAANIIIMTDGQATINVEKLREARALISEETPIHIMFIAINQTNEELKQFVFESAASAGFAEGSYREFQPQEIEQMRADSVVPPKAEDGRTFVQKRKFGSQEIFTLKRALDDAANQADRLKGLIAAEQRKEIPQEDWLFRYGRLTGARAPENRTNIETWINISLRSAFLNQAFVQASRELQQLVAHDVLQNFEKLTGKKIEDLLDRELGELRHYLKGE